MKKIVLTEEQLKTIILGAVGKEPLLEYYARVGFFGKRNELEIYIRTDDAGYIPHFHIRDTATQGKKFDACIELAENKYFSHGSHTDTLNARQRKWLAEFMEGKCQNPKWENNYEFAIDMWNANNSQMNIEYNGTIPDYRIIN